MQMDTLFDLASLTKVVATLPCVLRLVEQGLVRLDDPVSLALQEFAGEGREQVTVRHLLTHTSGLPAHRRFHEDGLSGDQIVRALFQMRPEAPPGARVVYSDLGFMLLGLMVERLSRNDLAAHAKKHVFEPLGMKDTMFRPVEVPGLLERVAATEFRKDLDRFMVGDVHDENAYALGGVAGHAGLFSTASDLCVYCQMILNKGIYGNSRVLSPASILAAAALQTPAGDPQPRGLGWLKMPASSSAAGDLLSPATLYHTGFTGTLIVIDPTNDLFIVLLTNRVHPMRQNESIIRLRPRFCNAVAASIDDWGGAGGGGR
jgi:CubicO group peptidase (beta-lactamase class C family)